MQTQTHTRAHTYIPQVDLSVEVGVAVFPAVLTQGLIQRPLQVEIRPVLNLVLVTCLPLMEPSLLAHDKRRLRFCVVVAHGVARLRLELFLLIPRVAGAKLRILCVSGVGWDLL